MKKIFLIMVLFSNLFLTSIAQTYEEDVIYLDIKNTPQKINNSKLNEPLNLELKKDINVSPQNINVYINKNPYEKQSASFTKEKTYGDFTFGTKYDGSFTPDKYTQSNTMYTKYKKNKFSIQTSYKNGGLTSWPQQGKGTLSFTPEYKLNNHVSIQNIYSTSFLDKSRKNEIVFTLKPFKDDYLNFDIGAGQIYFDNYLRSRSQLNFSTKIKF